ncbi:MAG: alpha/beta hydrolase [Candidatus Marinimicrobia bacterium]|nr:alpha/beta hydrolase [Candidatus Neomarinimicrobiota bacterium]
MDRLPAHHPFKSACAKKHYLHHYDQRAESWPVPADTMIVPTTYGKTFVRVSGPAAGPPLVLLPSTSANTLIWLPNIAALSRTYRVYAIDNIYDFGRSVYTKEITVPADLINWLDDLFTQLELGDSINLMGLSYGGWLTSQYALNHPERLRKIVLLAPVATVHQLPGEWAWRAIPALIPHRYFLRNFSNWMFTDLPLTEEGQALAEVMLEDAWQGMRAFKLKMPVNPTVLSDDELTGLQVPALFLVGENEVIYPANAALERLERVAPRIETSLIPDAGHDLTIVQADMVNQLVLEFLKD